MLTQEDICHTEKKRRFVPPFTQTIPLIKKKQRQFNHTFNNVSRKFSKKAKIKFKTPDIGLLNGRRKRDLDRVLSRDLSFQFFLGLYLVSLKKKFYFIVIVVSRSQPFNKKINFLDSI